MVGSLNTGLSERCQVQGTPGLVREEGAGSPGATGLRTAEAALEQLMTRGWACLGTHLWLIRHHLWAGEAHGRGRHATFEESNLTVWLGREKGPALIKVARTS